MGQASHLPGAGVNLGSLPDLLKQSLHVSKIHRWCVCTLYFDWEVLVPGVSGAMAFVQLIYLSKCRHAAVTTPEERR